jgi:hypothetical protein
MTPQTANVYGVFHWLLLHLCASTRTNVKNQLTPALTPKEKVWACCQAALMHKSSHGWTVLLLFALRW